MKKKQMQETVDQLIAAWAPRLGLAEWSIKGFVVPQAEVDRAVLPGPSEEGTLAVCSADPITQAATILVSVDWKWESAISSPMSLPVTVLHELLHVLFSATGLEIAISALAADGAGGREFALSIWQAHHKGFDWLAGAMLANA